jgi:hypothetical protein
MRDFSASCAVISLPDVELEAQISCARRRLVAIAPGFTESVAKAITRKWQELGSEAVQVVLDSDPEVCRLGFGDLAALKMLHETADKFGRTIHKQRGLRIGVIITDETTTVYSPIPRLIEAGGQPGERLNALRLDASVAAPPNSSTSDLRSLDLHTQPVNTSDLRKTTEDLNTNPPVKFDLARKVRVFNARFEFVEFELQGLFISRKRVKIPSDLLGLAKEPKAQKLLRSSFQLIEENSEVSEKRVTRLKQFIVKKFLINLPGFGTVVLRSNKADFQVAVRVLQRYVQRFQRLLKKKLQNAIETNREILTVALLPSVLKTPPARWVRYIGERPSDQDIERMLREELIDAFGCSDDLFEAMKVKALFKGVTYESLNDPEFMRLASEKLLVEELHEEFDAAKPAGQQA